MALLWLIGPALVSAGPTDIFPNFIAAPRELRSSADISAVRFVAPTPLSIGRGRDVTVAFTSIGDHVVLLGFPVVEVQLAAAVFAQFNLSTPENVLLNADYDVALPVVLRFGSVGVRLRLRHESSHLGDELLLAEPDVVREDFSEELVDGAVSYWWHTVRVYAMASYIFQEKSPLGRSALGLGVEWQYPEEQMFLAPFAAVDVQFLEARDFDSNVHLVAGVVTPGPHVRLGASLTWGYFGFGQFFPTTRVRSVGVTAIFDH